MDYSTWSVNSLNRYIDTYTNKLLDLKIVESPDQTAIEKLETEIQALNVVVATKEAEAGKPVVPDSPSVKNPTGFQIQKELQQAMRDNVPTFSPGVDVHSFIQNLELFYKLYVDGKKSPELEKMFVRLATGKMSVEYATSMTKHEPAVDDFANMKAYLKANHASKKTCYQTLDNVWDVVQNDSENLVDFARKIDEKCTEARNIIEAKYEKYKKDKSVATGATQESSSDFTMKSKDVFDLVSGQIFLQSLKTKSPAIFNSIVNDLDEVWTSVDIANRAMSFQERRANEDAQNQAANPSTFVGEGKSKQKNCWYFLNGECTRKKCSYLHDAQLQKVFSNSNKKVNIQKGKFVDKKTENEKSNSGEAKGQTHLNEIQLPVRDFQI